MKKIILLVLVSFHLNGQSTIDFEIFNLPIDSFANGEDGSQGFLDQNVFFPNVYDDSFGSWSGWAISTATDNTTPGFGNQYASIAGEGAEGSSHYATTFVLGSSKVQLESEDLQVDGFYVNNSTYAYLSMLEGDSFAKKFGGESGDDPDFFLLTIKKYSDGLLSADSIDFYLADYRFSDSSEDYLINDWTWIDLTGFGQVDSLEMTLSSSDVGVFGMNTPAYFCIDNFITSESIVNTSHSLDFPQIKIFPNPSSDFITVKTENHKSLSQLKIINAQGQLLYQSMPSKEDRIVDISGWPLGCYTLLLFSEEEKLATQLFIKN